MLTSLKRTNALRLYNVAICCVLTAAVHSSGCSDGDSTNSDVGQTDTEDGQDNGETAIKVWPETTARFREVTAEAGINFTYQNGQDAGHYAILESLGGGIGIIDFDGDGRFDVITPGGGEYGEGEDVHGVPPGLFANRGEWSFQNVAKAAGLSDAPFYTHGAAVADFDCDGFSDILFTGYGGLLLFHNMGDGTFEQIAAEALLDEEVWSSSAAWGDFNRDGHPDVFVAHYVDWSFKKNPECPAKEHEGRDVCPPRMFEPLPDSIYMSNGDGTFRDASVESGVVMEVGQCGKGLGVLTADVDLDGDIDVYVGNDTVANFLYRNDGHGVFQEFGVSSGTAFSERGGADGSMGVDLGDYNGDGLPDLWVANYERESIALYRNEGDCFFRHVSQSAGVTAVGGLFVGWGTAFLDFDRDGDEDAFVSNGHVIRHPSDAPLKQTPLLFENINGERFVNISGAAGKYLSSSHMGRGVALADLDNDGDQDLVICHTNEPVSILSNESLTDNNWISFRLIGRQSLRDATGVVVKLKTSEKTRTRQLKGGASYASTNDPRLYFGLGSETQIDQVTIRWPSGLEQEIEIDEVNRVVTVIEPVAIDG